MKTINTTQTAMISGAGVSMPTPKLNNPATLDAKTKQELDKAGPAIAKAAIASAVTAAGALIAGPAGAVAGAAIGAGIAAAAIGK